MQEEVIESDIISSKGRRRLSLSSSFQIQYSIPKPNPIFNIHLGTL